MSSGQSKIANIRNFCIIAHIDHGKSTLADRMLEITQSVEKRKMREQYLDTMDLERERGITIKMQPVRMSYTLNTVPYTLNLIDTPGHVDFSYEVSRALAAVEGAILLVDATKGVQAQTLSNLEMARALGLTIIPAVNKIDLSHARVEETKEEIMSLIGCEESDILEISARSGAGVDKLLETVVEKIKPPREIFEEDHILSTRALIFDFEYSEHKGIIAHLRVFSGEISAGSKLQLSKAQKKFSANEVGIFTPELKGTKSLGTGEIGFLVTGIKEAKIVRVGDTVLNERSTLASFAGYKEVNPVVFSSVYPALQDQFEDLRKALEKLKLVDSSLFFEEESGGVLGRGFRCGFLGMLHLEIVLERLKRDFNIESIAATPTVKYRVKTKNKEEEIYSPSKFPENHEIIEIMEPWIKIEVLLPPDKLAGVLKLFQEHEAEIGDTKKFSNSRMSLEAKMPLRELMRDFFDGLKSVSSGFASLSYEFIGLKNADLLRLDILVAEEAVPAFSRVVPKGRLERDAEEAVEKLYKILPKALFALKVQASAGGRILASRTLKAMSKDVTGYLYGGDRTRKMKLWKKQKEGKKKLSARAEYSIPADVYLKMIRK